MNSAFANTENSTTFLNDEMASLIREIASGSRSRREEMPEVNICGMACGENCSSCSEALSSLEAFFATGPQGAETSGGPTAAQIMPSAVSAESQESTLENARNLDAIDEIARSGEAFDVSHQEDNASEGDCDCLECRTGHVPELYFHEQEEDYGYDDGYGLDWNESGYFD
jgi:hypothetical protein